VAEDSPLAGARGVLAESAELIREIREMYERSLASQEVPARLPQKVKASLENQRSALDYLAYELTEAFGKSGSRTAYPLARVAADFAKSMKESLPGVATARPDVALAVERHQMFAPGYEWLDHLVERVNSIKHRRLTPQTRSVTEQITATGPGGSVSWNPAQVTFGAGVSILGQPVNPTTQLPAGTVTRTIYVDWLFEGTQLSVLGTLESIQEGVVRVIDDLGQLVGW